MVTKLQRLKSSQQIPPSESLESQQRKKNSPMFIVLENDFFFYSIGLTFLLSLHKILKTRRTKTLSQELFLPNLKKQIDNIHNWNCNNNLRFSQAQKQLLPLQFHLQFFYVQTYSTSLYCTMAYEMIQLASWGERKWKKWNVAGW